MNFKPTAAALEIARSNGTQEALNLLAGARANAASNPRAAGNKKARQRLTAEARKICGIPAGVQVFEPV